MFPLSLQNLALLPFQFAFALGERGLSFFDGRLLFGKLSAFFIQRILFGELAKLRVEFVGGSGRAVFTVPSQVLKFLVELFELRIELVFAFTQRQLSRLKLSGFPGEPFLTFGKLGLLVTQGIGGFSIELCRIPIVAEGERLFDFFRGGHAESELSRADGQPVVFHELKRVPNRPVVEPGLLSEFLEDGAVRTGHDQAVLRKNSLGTDRQCAGPGRTDGALRSWRKQNGVPAVVLLDGLDDEHFPHRAERTDGRTQVL